MTVENTSGGYAFTPGGLGFASNGVVALPGMAIDRAVLPVPVEIPHGFDVVRAHLDRVGRPLSALCGMEFRIPQALPAHEFETFNTMYMAQLDSWGLLLGDGSPPLTRTNVAPVAGFPESAAVLAFSYTVESSEPDATFVLSGVAELPERTSFPDGVVRRGETSSNALAEKTRCVIEVTAGRAKALGVVWDDTTVVHLYSAHDLAFLVQNELRTKVGVTPTHGLIWHHAAPPIIDLELEIDIRRYRGEPTLSTADL